MLHPDLIVVVIVVVRSLKRRRWRRRGYQWIAIYTALQHPSLRLPSNRSTPSVLAAPAETQRLRSYLLFPLVHPPTPQRRRVSRVSFPPKYHSTIDHSLLLLLLLLRILLRLLLLLPSVLLLLKPHSILSSFTRLHLARAQDNLGDILHPSYILRVIAATGSTSIQPTPPYCQLTLTYIYICIGDITARMLNSTY